MSEEFYRQQQQKAYEKMSERGTDITISTFSDGGLNKVTGVFTQGAENSVTTKGLILSKEIIETEKSERKEVLKVMLANWKDGAAINFEVTSGTKLNFNGSDHVIVKTEPFQIGGIIVFYNFYVEE